MLQILSKPRLVGLVIMLGLSVTPSVNGQQVFVVRDPQTGQRYEADLSAHPNLQQQGRALAAEGERLQKRRDALKKEYETMLREAQVIQRDQAALAALKAREPGSGSIYDGSLDRWVRWRNEYDAKSALIRRRLASVTARNEAAKLENNRINAEAAEGKRRLDQWNAAATRVAANAKDHQPNKKAPSLGAPESFSDIEKKAKGQGGKFSPDSQQELLDRAKKQAQQAEKERTGKNVPQSQSAPETLWRIEYFERDKRWDSAADKWVYYPRSAGTFSHPNREVVRNSGESWVQLGTLGARWYSPPTRVSK